MNTPHLHVPEDDLALFALALMSPEEAAYTQAHLKHCDQCRGEVGRMQGDLVAYAFSAEMQDPPVTARSRLLDSVAKEKRLHVPAPAAEPVLAPRATNLLDRNVREERPVNRGFGWFGWTGWALAAGLAAFAGWEFFQGEGMHEQLSSQNAQIEQVNRESARAEKVLHALTDPTAMQVALHLTAAGEKTPPKPEGHASYNASTGELVFVGTHLEQVHADKTYELWVLPADGSAPVAAGVFRPDINGNASVVLPEIPKHVAAKGFGITVENEGGSRTPTLPILLAGA